MLRLLLIGCSMVGLVGCIPFFHSEPYKDKQLIEIKTGETSRDEMVLLLGQPEIARENDAIWIYGRRDLALVLVSPIPSFVYDHQWLIVEFEDEVVKRYQLMGEK